MDFWIKFSATFQQQQIFLNIVKTMSVVGL